MDKRKLKIYFQTKTDFLDNFLSKGSLCAMHLSLKNLLNQKLKKKTYCKVSRLTASGMRTSWFRWGPGGPCRLFLFEGLGPWWTRGDCSCRGSCCGLSCSLQVSRGHRGRFGVASSLFEKNVYFVILKTKDLNHILQKLFFFFKFTCRLSLSRSHWK